MTKKEAIEILKQYSLYSPTSQIEEALDMAIKALSAEDVSRDVYDKRTQADEKIIDSYRKEFQKALQTDAVSREAHYDAVANRITDMEERGFVSVVRCKDCMHRHEYECPMYHEEWFTIDEGDGYVDDDYNVIDKTDDDGFCNCGERREE